MKKLSKVEQRIKQLEELGIRFYDLSDMKYQTEDEDRNIHEFRNLQEVDEYIRNEKLARQ
jgi:hypothetical protein